MERLGAPGGVDGGLAESSGSLSKRKRSQTPQDNCRQIGRTCKLSYKNR